MTRVPWTPATPRRCCPCAAGTSFLAPSFGGGGGGGDARPSGREVVAPARDGEVAIEKIRHGGRGSHVES